MKGRKDILNNCVFCKIINGEIETNKIYEDDYVLAFLDIAKDVDGHTLVIPKKHFRNMLDCDEVTLLELIRAIKKIMNHYKSKGYDGFNLICSNEPSAEQSVFHLHFHIYPRKEDDGMRVFPKLDNANHTLSEMCEYLKLN